MNIVAIVQARLGSTRLPKKSLREILGKPMLLRVVERLKQSKLITSIGIATTTNPIDDEIAAFAQKNSIPCHRGSEMDLIDRFYGASKQFNADVIVRIWGDCVMIDSAVVDKVIQHLLDNKLDFCGNNRPATFPRGMDCEVMTFSALEKAWAEAKGEFLREYMSDYIVRNPTIFKTGNVVHEKDLSHIYLLVDYEDDLKLMTAIYEEMRKNGKEFFSYQEALELLDKNPQLKQMNAGLQRYQDYLKELKKQGLDPMGWDKNAGTKP